MGGAFCGLVRLDRGLQNADRVTLLFLASTTSITEDFKI